MQSTKATLLVIAASISGVLACFFGIYQVSHGQQLPVASANSIFTLPLVAIVLAILAFPIYRYRKQLLAYTKVVGQSGISGNAQATPAPVSAKRPNPLNPFYAVRVLLLAKSVSVTSAVICGWHAGLVALQLSTPVVTSSVWNNAFGFIGAVFSMALALAVERICRLPNGGKDDSGSGSTAVKPNASEVTAA